MNKSSVKVGDDAPLFKIESYNAGIVDLKEMIGNQKIVIIFSRYFGCNICQLDMNTLLKELNAIESKGAKILYITQSGEKVANEFIEKHSITFPVIHSTKDELYAGYGLGIMTAAAASKIREKLKEATALGIEHGEYEGWEKQGPGQFVVDEQGKIIHAEEGWLDVPALMEVL